jgi:hypothetical protein
MNTAGKPYQVRTKRPVKEGATPRLPHEHDESEDSQASGPRGDIKRAYDDIMEGQVDTDLREQRGVEEVVKKPESGGKEKEVSPNPPDRDERKK